MKKLLKKGFTLVELVVVIAVIAILSAVSVGAYVGVVEAARQSTYLQTAQSNLTTYLTENNATLEENSYIFVSEDDKNVAWFKYENSKLNKLNEEPELDADYLYPMGKDKLDYLDESVTFYRPLVKNIVLKLNGLLLDSSATNYSKLADAGNKLTDFELEIINYKENEYNFAYSLTTNKVFIASEDLTSILYSSTGISTVPSDAKIFVGKNIYTADDLVTFSTDSNKHLDSTKDYKPAADNPYVKADHSKAPLVLANIKDNIDLTNKTWKPICNWCWFTDSSCNLVTKTQQIKLLFNGNNNTISGLTNSLIGTIDSNTIIQDIKLNYVIGTSDAHAASNTLSSQSLKNNNDYSPFHYGLLACSTLILKDQTSITVSDTIIINNVKIGGQVYIDNAGGTANEIGILLGGACMKYNGHTMTPTGNEYQAKFSNCDLFTGVNDTFVFDAKNAGDSFALCIANPDTEHFDIEGSTIVRNDSNIHFSGKGSYTSYYGGSSKLPYLGVIG